MTPARPPQRPGGRRSDRQPGPGAPAPRRSEPRRSDPRRLALAVLRAVHEQGAYANLVLPGLLRESGLPDRDRALATELAYGTLRAEGTLDHVLALCSSRPLSGLDPDVWDLLRLGAYQLLRTRIPPHAAVSTTVDLAVGPGPRRFVNAVLRALGRRLAAPDPLGLDSVEDPLDRLALRAAHPRWVVDAYAAALDGTDELEAALLADDERPCTHLAARPGRIGRAELLAAAGPGAAPGRWSPYAVQLAGGEPGALAPVRDGRAGVQDEGSQLCALALHRAAPPGLLVDLCAGPGGKSALLAGLRPQLLAVEKAAHRAALVRASGVGAVVQADGRRAPVRLGSASAVLVDAPCSGLGALRRRPEARWRKQPADLPALVDTQRSLLEAALLLVRPGGVVGYVVCSPHLAEAVVAPRPGFRVLDAPAVAGVTAGAAGPPGRLQLWPHRHGTDALSLTLLQRER